MAPAPAKDRTATRNGRRSERGRVYHPAHDIDTVLARLRRHARHQGRRGRLPVRGRRLARGRRRPALPRFDRGAVVLHRRVRAARDRRCGRGAARCGSRRIRRSVPTRPNRPSTWPIDWPPSPRSTMPSSSSDRADRTRSIRAAKLARRYWDVQGRPEKRVIVSREHGYHGMHAWGTALAGIPGNKAGYGGEIIEEVVNVGAVRHREPRRAVRVARRGDRGVHRRAGDRGRRRLPARAVVLGRGPAAVP